MAAFIFALHQFILKYLWDQSAYTRTPGGILLILFGFAGIALPLVLYRKRDRFLAMRLSRQWLCAIGIPLAYVLVLGACLEAALRSRTTILRRPFTSDAVVQYSPGDSRVAFRGGWKPSVGPCGYNNAKVHPDGTEHFSSHLSESFMRDALGGKETVTIIGRARREDDGTVNIVLSVDAKESINIVVENLDDVKILQNGRPLIDSQSRSGTFELTITGRPKLRI
jgi:hypothetical protein